MEQHPYLGQALRRWRHLLILAIFAWLPAAVLTMSMVVFGGGADALRENVFMTVLLSHAAVAAGYALAVPAMLRVLHRDMEWRDAARGAWENWPLNVALAVTVVPTSLLAASFWPEIWGTVSEVLAIQMLSVAPIVLACQLAWMQQVGDGGDAPTVFHDTYHLIRLSLKPLLLALVPVYAVAYGIAASNLVPMLTAPVALTLISVPFTAWTWRTWCHATGARPAWAAPRRAAAQPIRAVAAAEADTAVVSDANEPAAKRLAPVLLGGGGPARLELVTTQGMAAGAWLQLEPADTFTTTVRIPGDDSRDWAVYLWRPGGQWRELEQLWNDGRHVIAHGTCWGDRAYVAVARRDGAPGLPFTAWVSVATQQASHPLPAGQDAPQEAAA